MTKSNSLTQYSTCVEYTFLYVSFDIPVLESLARIDWTVRDGPHPIHPRRMPLNHTVPVNGQSFHQQIILDIHYNLSNKIYQKTFYE